MDRARSEGEGNAAAALVGPVVLLGVAVLFAVLALDLPIGSPRRMGPGFLPLVLSIILGVLSAVLIVEGLPSRQAGKARAVPQARFLGLRGIACNAAGVAAFVLLLPAFGLLPAVFVATAILAQSRPGLGPWQTGAVATATTLGAWVVFILLLDLTVAPFEMNVPWIS